MITLNPGIAIETLRLQNFGLITVSQGNFSIFLSYRNLIVLVKESREQSYPDAAENICPALK